MSNVPNFVQGSVEYSFKRKNWLSSKTKKITHEMARKEIEVAQILGEISGVERVLDVILQLKKQHPDFTIEDVEAAIHVFLHTGLNYISESNYGVQGFSMERIMKVHGYFDNKTEQDVG